MATPSASQFDCPNCGARNKTVRVESDKIDLEGEVVCRRCGAPLQGREGRYILKYFLVNERRDQTLRLRIT